MMFPCLTPLSASPGCVLRRRPSAYRAVRATAEQAQLLNLSLGEPLLYLNAYFHDQYDHPLCIGRQYYIGSRYMFEF